MAHYGRISRKGGKMRAFRLLRGIRVERFLVLEKAMTWIAKTMRQRDHMSAKVLPSQYSGGGEAIEGDQ